MSAKTPKQGKRAKIDKFGTSCLKSGFCCTVAPCIYGELSETGKGCKHLLEPNEIGQLMCGIYDEIIKREKDFKFPMMGSGCSSTLYNTMRDKVAKKLFWREQRTARINQKLEVPI